MLDHGPDRCRRLERSADAGVGRDLVAEPFVETTDRPANAGHKVGNIGLTVDPRLNDREFFVGEPRDEIIRPTELRSLTATAFNNSSPMLWPSESLMPLNSSTST
jgi:hypothetical protein